MNDEQYKRFRKMSLDRIECLFKKADDKNLYFLVAGSQAQRYKVQINKETGKIFCGCPDFTHNCKVQECVCKHCLFVIYHVLKLFKTVDENFFKRLFFTPDEVQRIKAKFTQIRNRPNLF